VAARVPGMAAHKSFEGEPGAPRCAVATERLERIGRTRGMKAAVHAKHGAEAIAIGPNEERQHFGHDVVVKQRSSSAKRTFSAVKLLAVKRIRMSRLPSRS